MNSAALQIMDVTALRAVVTDLRQKILPSRFEKAQQPEPGTIQIGLRTLEGLIWLELSWHAEAPRLVQISPPSRIGSESTLAQQIQHGLNQMALVEIKQNGFERVVKFELAQRLGVPVQKTLVIELMGRHSNLFLLNDQNKIITAGRQVGNHQSRVMPISTGDFYIDPPALKGKEPSSEESFKRWRERLCLIPYKLKQALQENYQGISPSLAQQLVNDKAQTAQNILEFPVEELTEEQWQKLYARWCDWLHQLESEDLSLFFLGPTAFRLWKENIKDLNSTKDISLSLGKYYKQYLNHKKINSLAKEINKKLISLIESEEKYLFEQERLLNEIPKNKLMQKEADNLLCLNSPNKAQINSAQKLYQKAKRIRRSLPMIEERISYHKQRLLSIQDSAVFLDKLRTNQWDKYSDKLISLIELRQELNQFKKAFSNNKNKQIRNNSTTTKERNPQPLILKSPSGLEVQIGRNHRQNEWISLRKSRTGDIWFHVQECPGSHVVLKASNGLAEEMDIQMAADLAAFFSRAKGNHRVPVLMVPTDNLQRIPGAAPGAVRHHHGTVCWGRPSRGMQHIKS